MVQTSLHAQVHILPSLFHLIKNSGKGNPCTHAAIHVCVLIYSSISRTWRYSNVICPETCLIYFISFILFCLLTHFSLYYHHLHGPLIFIVSISKICKLWQLWIYPLSIVIMTWTTSNIEQNVQDRCDNKWIVFVYSKLLPWQIHLVTDGEFFKMYFRAIKNG